MAVDDSITEKRCTKCGEVKPLTEFGRHRGRDHAFPSCFACVRAYRKEWYRRNIEERTEKRRAYEEVTREKRREYSSAYYRENIERFKLRNSQKRYNPEKDPEKSLRNYYKNHDRIKAIKRERWRNNKERYSANNKLWREANVELCRVFCRNYKARKRLAQGRHTAEDVAAILKAQRGRCAACRTDVRDGFHVDHIQPLSKGGANDKSNLQVLCPSCNTSKGAKDPIDFARSRGLLL